MLPMSSGRKVLKLARHDVQVRKFMTAPGLGPITALSFKATIRTASSDREVLAPMSDQEPGRTSIGSLPLDQWRHARVEAIEVQEVEGVVDHPFITVWLEVRVLPGPPNRLPMRSNQFLYMLRSPQNKLFLIPPEAKKCCCIPTGSGGNIGEYCAVDLKVAPMPLTDAMIRAAKP